MMDVSGLCDICGEPAKHLLTCTLCGKRVCSNCITVRGACRDCMGGKKVQEKVPDDLVDRLI